MSTWWGSTPAQAEFDTLLDKTTSDLVPSSTPVDLALSLQLADLIRSASVPPASASKSLAKRLEHANPNVQLLALDVVDVCVKNGGTPFLVQIADRDKDFYSALERLARDAKNRDVRDKASQRVQEWAVAFKGKDQLRETQLVKSYDRLKREGVAFPHKDPTATAAMVDSLSAPEWQDSSYCTRCRTDFSTFNRKHHCRNCGHVFDAACSSQTAPLPHYGITQQVRVCDGCHKKIKEGKGAEVARNQSVKSSSSSSAKSSGGGHGRTKSRKEQEDEDLRKAIAASLEESSSSSAGGVHSHGPLRGGGAGASPPKSSGYNPSYASNFGARGDSKKSSGGAADEEDADLAAAIAASLRDVAPVPNAPSFDRQDSGSAASLRPVTYAEMFPPANRNGFSHSAAAAAATRDETTPRPRIHLASYDLDPEQLATLDRFTNTMTPRHPGASYLTGPEHELANVVVRDVQPKLGRSVEDARRRASILRELEWKLGEAARLYGAGLIELDRVYQRREAPYGQVTHGPIQQQTPVHPQYQYDASSARSLVGQPLPGYAIGSPGADFAAGAAAAPVRSPTTTREEYDAHDQAQSRQHVFGAAEPEPRQRQQQPVGYYKASSFPNVPLTEPPPTTPMSLESLPRVPKQDPSSWGGTNRDRPSEREEDKVGELIQF